MEQPEGRSLFFGAGGYLGWIPALRILAPATQHPVGRTSTMILAHLVWGMTLASLVHEIRMRKVF